VVKYVPGEYAYLRVKIVREEHPDIYSVKLPNAIGSMYAQEKDLIKDGNT
jgi:hypothetical protein